MDQIVRNVVSLGLLVLLFTAIARRAPNDRLRCWVAGWALILIQRGLQLWRPAGAWGRLVNVCTTMDTLALAAIFFLVSTFVEREGRRAGLRMGGAVALATLPCLTLALALPRAMWLLGILVVVRQAVVVWEATRRRVHRGAFAAATGAACAVSLAWMLYGITHGHSEFIVFALLGEMYLMAAAGFWFNGWERTLGLAVTCSGVGVFAASFPAGALMERGWVGSLTVYGLAGVSSFCMALGMILIVLEEDARSARQLTEEYRFSFETNPHPLWIIDRETLKFLAANDAACRKHGYPREEFLKLTLPNILDPTTVAEALESVASGNPVPNSVSRHICKDGSAMEMEITAHDVVFQGRPGRFVLGIDVSEREELERQVLHYSHHDPLTGLLNRGSFEERMESAVERAVKVGEKLAVLCLNLDRFKRINDTYGTAIGDGCLKAVAEILRGKAGAWGLAARMGGDRFALALSGFRTGLPVEHVISELMEAFREPVMAAGTRVRISIRAGLALSPDDGVRFAPVWRSAESALERAREAGGGQVIWSNPELRTAAEQQLELETFMRTQLEERGFHLDYQPMYAMDGQVRALEALLRLSHPARGPISPGRFIPVAEEAGLIIPIGDWVINEVCRQLRSWQSRGIRTVPIAVNVSGLQLTQRGFAERLMGITSHFGVRPEELELEVTESTDMLNEQDVTRQMEALSEAGIRFSIDDFGTGHSTLNRLDKLPIHVLKVDRTFTERVCEINGSRSIVQAMISMAKALHMRVVAEGVEREEQILALREMGCDYLQGFLLSRPAPAADIPPLLERRHPLLWRGRVA